MKIDIDNVESTLLEKKIDPKKVSEIIRDLKKAVEEEKNDAVMNSQPRAKQNYVIVIHDPESLLAGKELTGFVVQQKEEDDANLILSKLSDAAKNQNESAKKKKNLINNLVDLFANLKPKFAKEKNIKIKTKELTRVIISDGKIL